MQILPLSQPEAAPPDDPPAAEVPNTRLPPADPLPETDAEEPAGPRATPDQLRAIEARGGDVVVSAGAGSGKTFVLVERFMGLVRDGVAPERILTITFTERAAQEMAERIGRALEKEGIPDARSIAENAWISTIHGFCARLLRERALEAGVDPAFQVMTDVPAAPVRRAAFLQAQRGFRADRPRLYHRLVERVRWGRTREGLSGIRQRVLSLYDEIRAAGAPLRRAPREAPPADALLVDEVRVALERLAERVTWLMAGIAATPRKTAYMQRKAAAISELAARISAAPLDRFRVEVYRDLAALGRAASGHGSVAAELASLREAAETAAGAYAEGPARGLGAGIEDLLGRFHARYAALKAESSALDFADLEERTRELLAGRADVRSEVQQRFQAVLVDEFQDTSRLQQRILDLVRSPGRLFAVGDVKQSIYGFRHARVQGLLDLEAEAREGGGEAVVLDRSFRTRPEILAFVDELFARVWGEPQSEVPHQPLRAGVPFAPIQQPCVELLVGRGERLARARIQEARAVAARLTTLVETRALRGTNPLREESYGRPLSYGDVAILLPATTALAAYERALRERGVPYRVASGRGFYAVREVVDAVTLLQITASAHDDLAMLAFLRSPAAGLSDAGLLELTRERERERTPRTRRSLYEALGSLVARDALPEPDRRRAAAALQLVEELRARRGRCTTREILAHGLEASGLLDGSLLRGGDVRGFANLQKLLEVVDELEQGGVSGPGAVAGVLLDLRLSGARESEANVSGEDEDAVSVLTVHASKGLEWPVVVVGDLGRYARRGDEPMLWSEETGVVPHLRDPDAQGAGPAGGAIVPASLARLQTLKKAREREESKRLLYVGMTRARDHLILAGAQSERARSSGDWLAWTRSILAAQRRPLATLPDEALQTLARVVVSREGQLVRCLELSDALEAAPVQGPQGPAADALPILDPRACHELGRGRLPHLPQPSEELAAQATELQGRAEDPRLPPLDHGASLYTVSEVLAWRRCPRQALFAQVVGDARPWAGDDEEGLLATGWRGDGWGGVPATVRGTLVHELLARAVGLGLRPSTRWAAACLEQLLPPGTGTPEGRAESAERAVEIARRFLETRLGRRARELEGARCELPFLISFDESPGGPVLLRGTCDLLLPGPQGWTLVDYKGAELTALEVPTRLERDEVQLRLYTLALERLGMPVARALLVYLVPNIIDYVDIGPGTMAETHEMLRDFVRARRELDLPPRPGPVCRSCDWREACDASVHRRPASPRAGRDVHLVL